MSYSVCILGLGYVGLQLAISFGKKQTTFGYDVSKEKIERLKNFNDQTKEVTRTEFTESKYLSFTNDPKVLKECKIIIIAVPTPIDENNAPDLTLLKRACQDVGRNIKKNAIIIFESTVYPGTTEEFCVPIIEKLSSLKWKVDFNVGYSPERINPGDKFKKIDDVIKVVAGDSKRTIEILFNLYSLIVKAGVYIATSIKVAETAKVIENTQRDLNIALMNELSIICNKLGVDTNDVIDTASTKWNFNTFRPGLVGGHCIGVDPYYLTYKSQLFGYNPEVILAGRKINDYMSEYLANQIRELSNKLKVKNKNKINILGITFKENCVDIRNSKVYELYKKLKDFGFNINIHDPIANSEEVEDIYKLEMTSWDDLPSDSGMVVLAVMHDFYKKLPVSNILSKLEKGGLIIDIKSIFNVEEVENLGYKIWRL